jgi:HEPN domain-containing protein
MDERTRTPEPEDFVRYWTINAKDAWRSARHLFEKRDYPHSLFFAHLYLESLLKALIVERTRAQAPYGHGLRFLAEKAGLELEPDQVLFLIRVTEYNLRGRYADWLFEFKRKCTRAFCQGELKEIERLGKWLRKQITD